MIDRLNWLQKRWRSALALALVGLVLTSTPMRADENWESAQRAFDICLLHYPNVQQIHKALDDDGWRYEGSAGGFKIHSKNGYRVIAATQENRKVASKCFVASSKLAPEPAVQYARKIAAQIKDARPIDLSKRGVVAAWEGTLRGKTVGSVANFSGCEHFGCHC